MAIFNRAVSAGVQQGQYGLRPEVINWNAPLVLGSYKVSNSNNVYTTQTVFTAASVNSTLAPATNIDFPRNLVYQLSLTNGTASSAMISGGTFVVLGRLDNGSTASESVAFTRLAAASVGIQGTTCFARVDTLSYSNVSLATASSSASNSVSFYIGVGNKVGIPWSVKQTNPSPFPWAWIGTSIQLTTSHTDSTSSNAYTVITGPIGSAGLSMSNALATNTPVLVRAILNR